MINKHNQEQLNKILKDHARICELLTYEEILVDKKLFLSLEKQKLKIDEIVEVYKKFVSLQENIKEFENLKVNCKSEETLQINNEINFIKDELSILNKTLTNLLIKYNNTIDNITVEIVDLSHNSNKLYNNIINGYVNFATRNNFHVNSNSQSNSTTLNICGIGAYELFKNEIGTHKTTNDMESCLIFVYESIMEDVPSFEDSDFIITTYRASGAGGQHINTTDSAIRVIHKKTNLSSVCQNERSQLQNKLKAIENLKVKVTNHYLKLNKSKLDKIKKQQLSNNNKSFVKQYDYRNNLIIRYDKNTISLKDFTLGNTL